MALCDEDHDCIRLDLTDGINSYIATQFDTPRSENAAAIRSLEMSTNTQGWETREKEGENPTEP